MRSPVEVAAGAEAATGTAIVTMIVTMITMMIIMMTVGVIVIATMMDRAAGIAPVSPAGRVVMIRAMLRNIRNAGSELNHSGHHSRKYQTIV
ncbi:hypothetical protein K3556_05685 [Aliiroseovarius sp. M344]|uniref:hypothetical protein n=1 Tax=Aliiroseovarius sp. M344 TaxID=2867010 RepID=UPI0021AE123E|nr:hypothetical protein [Aliiroseovarius sp. M344]UWQ15382.1 hypothetical protein K3556_05685 [Aliiroseovarius sp. M344]